MICSGLTLASLIRQGNDCKDGGLAVVPPPDLDKLASQGEAAVDLRLGRWFLSLRQSGKTHFDVTEQGGLEYEERVARLKFVPFGDAFTVHPGRFVLASTLEWIRLPSGLSGFVTGKSSLGRRGLIIETAAGIHPGFSGCLTLELANVGEVPVQICPGMLICQVFVHRVDGGENQTASNFAGRRRPALGILKRDPVLELLRPKGPNSEN